MPSQPAKLLVIGAKLSKSTKSEHPEKGLPRNWSLLSIHDSDDGRLRAVDYQHTSGIVITTFRCTDRWDNVRKDDFHLFWYERLHPDCVAFADAQIERVNSTYHGKIHHWNGYSLGGGLAEYCGLKTGEQTFVQDSSGMGKVMAIEHKNYDWSHIYAAIAPINEVNSFATHFIPAKNITRLPGESHHIELILDPEMGRSIKLSVKTGLNGRHSHNIDDMIHVLKDSKIEMLPTIQKSAPVILDHRTAISPFNNDTKKLSSLCNPSTYFTSITPGYHNYRSNTHSQFKQPALVERIVQRIEPRIPSTIESLMGPPVRLSDVASHFSENNNPRAKELFKNAKFCK